MNLTSHLKAIVFGFALVVSLTGGLPSSSAATITRGPYLQLGTPGSIILRWRTDVATDTYVRFGTNAGVFTTTFSDALPVTEHSLTVTGLPADTKHFYELGTSSSWFPGDTNDFFVTSPPVGTAKPTRLWVLGDSGTGNANAAAVRNAYLAYSAARPADLVLMLGDNAYNNGTDSEYQSAVFNMYPGVLQNTVLWSTIGNHDTAQSSSPPPTLPYFNIFDLPQNGEAGGVASGTEKYYSFDYGQIHFICLDSMSSDRSTNGPMYAWLVADLQANTQTWAIAFWHHPPYTKGSHNSDSETELVQMRQNFLPTLEAFGVDLALCGHSHSYERSFLIDGHYGDSSTFVQAHKKDGGDGRMDGTGAYVKPGALGANQGVVYAVAGSSGQISGGPLNHAAMLVSLNQLGSLVIDIESNRLDLVFLKTNATAGDYFTIIKTPPATNAPAAPTALNAAPLSSSQINLAWTDNSPDEAGFKIERSTNGLDFTQFVTVGANVVSGFDAGLNPSTTYYYRVRAFNSAGDSPYSNIAQATTLAAPVTTTLIASNSVWKYLDNGTDQGTTWSTPAFNDAAWAAGPAELGYGDGGEATVVSFGPNASAKYITTYFRKTFTVADPSAYTNLLLQVVRDDGAVVYLNGVEVWRANLPAGPIAFNTLAPSAIGGTDESTYLSANISPANLAAGNNVIAVEMHQNAGSSSDLSFNLQLTASGSGTPPGDTTAPAAIADLSVNSVTTSSATLAWTAPGDDGNTGTATSYDVRYSTAPISEANWASATQATGEPAPTSAGTVQSFTVSGLASGMTYYFAIKTADEASNISPLSNVPSVTTAQTPPGAPTSLTANAISSGEVALAWTDNSNNEDGFYVERSTNGVDFILLGSTGANVTSASDLSVQPLAMYHYRVRAFNSAGESANSNVASVTTPGTGPSTNVVLIASNSVWKYLDNGTDQGTAWRAPAFNDATWAAGPAELGYGDGGEATIVSYGPNASAKYITTYFRKSFTVANPAAYTNLLLQLVRDDGAVVYLNGVEVFRANLPTGAIVFNTLAPAAIGGADESAYISANISLANLVAGNNVIAVEMHQNAGSSSDLSFNLQLTATGSGAPPGDTTAPAAIADLAVNSVTTSSATLAWTAPGDDGNTGTATGYDVRYSTAPITEANWASAAQAAGEPSPALAGTAQTFTVSGLASGTTYHFAIKTSDEAGNISPLSNIPSATTAQTPPAAPTALTANAISSGEVALAWTDNASNEDGFYVERSTNGVDFVLLGSTGANATSASDLSVQPMTTYHYRVRAFNSAGESANSNVASVTTPGIDLSTNVVLIASNAVWKFLDNGTDQGTAWRATAYDDSAWASGPAELGYGDGGEATIVSFGPNASAKYITTYFRKSFTVGNPGGFTNLLLQLVRDDGAVVYLNGVEIYRNNLPAGAVTFQTLAPLAIGGADETTYLSASLSPAALVSGVNVVAVEMHQANGTSTDLSFNLQLTAQGVISPPAPDTNAPSAVSDLGAGNVTTNSVTLTWTAPGNDGITGTASSYDVRLSLAPITEANWDSATPVNGEQTPGVAGTLENLTIINLAPATTYYFALKTSDETNNVSPLSNVASATTLPPPDVTAPSAVTDLATGAITTNSVALTWTAPGDDSATGTAASYDVRYSTAPITEANWASATPANGEPAPEVAGTLENLTIINLDAATTYYFALKTSDETNNVSPLSNVASTTTLPPPDVTAPAAVTDLATGTITTNSVALTWTAPGDDGASGTASSYDVRYSVAPITEANWASATPATGEPAPSVAGSVETFVVTGLSSGTSYFFAVKTSDETNNVSPLSNVASATTLIPPDITAPAAVVNLAVASVTTNSATLTWIAPGDDGASGTASSYDVRYSPSPITAANWASATPMTGEPSPTPGGSAQSFIATGLASGQTYYFALTTSDEANNVSPLSNVPVATTAGVPGPWLTRDIGAVAAAGSANHTNGIFTVRGSGADIAGSADEFRYVYQSASGNCEIIARVEAVQNTHAAAKAAVMIRESLNANSRHMTMALTAGNGLACLRRTGTGGGTSSVSGGSGTAPYWVRLVRTGNTITAYRSINGTTWTTVDTRTISMGTNVFIGLAVTSRNDGTLNTSRFTNVTATP